MLRRKQVNIIKMKFIIIINPIEREEIRDIYFLI